MSKGYLNEDENKLDIEKPARKSILKNPQSSTDNTSPSKKSVKFEKKVEVDKYNYRYAHKDSDLEEDVPEFIDKARHLKLIKMAVPYYNFVSFLSSEGYEDKAAEETLKESIKEDSVKEIITRSEVYDSRKAEKIFKKWDEIPEINLKHKLVGSLVRQQDKSYKEAEEIAQRSIENGSAEDILSDKKGFWQNAFERRNNSNEEECHICRIM